MKAILKPIAFYEENHFWLGCREDKLNVLNVRHNKLNNFESPFYQLRPPAGFPGIWYNKEKYMKNTSEQKLSEPQ